ncbi:MAG: Hsp20/alpha crystallin family protein [Planctomycetes bacterium]|jgi:HSP20 family protein|nr:Hsp20/alpha crystallin family protein [Planctomycetota bacterium]
MFFTRWSTNPVWRSLGDVQHEVNRIFDRWGQHPFGIGEFPLVNLREDDDALHLEAELPGLALEDLEIYVTGNTQLTLKGERKPPVVEKGLQHRQERAYGKFTRTLTLPFAVDDSAVEARFEDGVLKIRLPKHEAAKPRKIAIKG